MKVFSILNNKGGAGKTTITFLLASHLASKYNKKILLIDFDSQASLSTIYAKFNHNINDALLARWSLVECLNKVAENIYLIPCTRELQTVEVKMQKLKNGEFVLKTLIEELKEFTDFDYCFIDSNPTINLLQLNILNAIDSAIIPINASFLDWAGLELLLDTINNVKMSTNPNLSVEGIIINQFSNRSRHEKDIYEYINKNYNLLGTVSQAVAIKDAYLKKQSLYELDKKHKVNNQLDIICKELGLI